ncbi:DUF7388 family protein [Halococcus salifodinae]|uniref:Uncharacterized protein n=1 Tax=Halococcus salifodinae DSM 8989 TaxID=1227456 RepID=M0NCM8_9EURY|nr:hypothetical protein C450_04483 [Halococcus salifodinae DSM 8989]
MNPDGRHTTKAVSSESSPPSASDDPSGGSKAVGWVLVAGYLRYLSDTERKRAVAPRFGAAHENAPDAWNGTEGVERLALPTGGTPSSNSFRRRHEDQP